MNKMLLIAALLCIVSATYAQDVPPHHGEYGPPHRPHHHHYQQETMHHGPKPFSYIGFSSGINNPAGAIGFDFDLPIHNYLTLGVGGGFSSWGNKLHAEAKYFLKRHQRGWALGGGFTFNSGDNNFTTKPLETITGLTEKVTVDLHTQRNVFFALYHYWSLGRRYNRFFAAAGWSVPLVNHRFTQLTGDPLTQHSINKIDYTAPGGLMISLGFSFGLHH